MKTNDKILTVLTEADRRALDLLPVGWFEIHEVSANVLRPTWRCDRLARLGMIKKRVDKSPIKCAPGHFFHTPKYQKPAPICKRG